MSRDDNMRWIKERVKTSWDWNSMLLKDLLNFQYHLRIYMNKRNNVEKSLTPIGISRRISAFERLT
jgi:hypothetical protein